MELPHGLTAEQRSERFGTSLLYERMWDLQYGARDLLDRGEYNSTEYWALAQQIDAEWREIATSVSI